MDLRKRTSTALAGAGAVLIVGSLSLGGVALAETGPAGPAAERDVATTSSSEPKPSKPRKADSDKSKSDGDKSKSDSDKSKDEGKSRSDGDKAGDADQTRDPDQTGDADSAGTTDTTRGGRSTGATATSTTATTRTTPTTRPTPTTATTRPSTATTSPPGARPSQPTNTGTTAPPRAKAEPARDSTGTSPQQVEPGTDSSTGTTAAQNGAPSPDASPAPNRPNARSGSGLPPGMYPVGPGSRSVYSTPSATIAPAPIAPVAPPPEPVEASETQPAEDIEDTTADAGVSDPATMPLPADAEVGGAELERGGSSAPARRSSAQLGQTGDGTRRLILFGGVAMLLGAVAIAFTGRDRPRPAYARSVPAGPAYHPRPRRELDGWEQGVPLAPVKREMTRSRLGLSDGYPGLPDDGPGA